MKFPPSLPPFPLIPTPPENKNQIGTKVVAFNKVNIFEFPARIRFFFLSILITLINS